MNAPPPIDVRPATADRWPDLAPLFSGTPSARCWCAYWRLSAGAYATASPEERRQLLRDRVGREPAPGMIAYVGGEAVGWCSLGPRVGFERLVRSRTIPAIDDRPVWAIVCFRVKTGHRRRGVARALLEGAVAYARSQGAVGLEAYPVDRGERRIRAPDAYVGILRMFDMAGFRRVVATEARSAGLRRWLVRLDL